MSKQYRPALLIFAFLVACLTGWRMWDLFQNDALWGYLPLIFFIAAWIFLMGMIMRFNKKVDYQSPERRRRLLLSTLSGILLAVAFPNTIPDFFYGKTLLVFLGFVPLLLIENEIKEEPRSGRQLMFYSFNAFAIWNMLATFWVANTAFLAGIVAVWLNAFFMSIPFWLFHKTKKYVPRLGYLAFISYWISFEHLHLHWEISWSWLNLGNFFCEYPSWIQWYEYTGTFGGTLWVLLVNVFIFKAIANGRQVGDLKKLSGIAGLILFPILASYFMYQSYEQKGPEAEVVVIQPNFEPHYEKFEIAKFLQLRQFMKLADSAITDKTKYLLFPETSFGIVEITHFWKNREIETLRGFLKKYPQLTVITGIDAYKEFAKEDPDTPHTRTFDNGKGKVMRYEVYNGAIQMRQNEEKHAFYKKSKFVPGAEIFPYSSLLFFMEPLVNYLGGSAKGLGSQSERTPFENNGIRIAPSICYESIFGEYNNGYIRRGANAIFIMTNDGWWDDTPGHRQHLKLARLRAIETRRDIARSANTGISGFINQRGDILQPTKYDEALAVRGMIGLNDEITFYVIWGDMIARLALFTTLILLANLLARAMMKR